MNPSTPTPPAATATPGVFSSASTAPAVNPKVQAVFDQYKQSNPPPAASTGTSDWYSGVKSGAYRPATPAVKDTSEIAGASLKGPGSPNTLENIGSDLNKRIDTAADIQASSDNPVSKTLQTIGNGAGAVNDVIGEGIKAVIPSGVTKAAGDALEPLIEKAQNSPAGQKILNWWADLQESHPEAAKNLEATGNIASLLSNALGAGAAKEVGVEGAGAVLDAGKTAVKPLAQGVKTAATAVKDTAASATKSVTGIGKKSFQDVYNSHAQSSKPLSNAFKANTIVKDGKTITPVDTMESYSATPKVSSNTKGGHVLDMSDVQEEATTKGKAASKVVDDKVKNIDAQIPKKDVLNTALEAASKDKEVTRTASVPGVTTNIKQIFKDYGIEGDHLTPEQVNEFRKGANTASQAYYNSKKIAATAGTIPKDVADRAQAFAILGDTFRDTLTKLDPTLDKALTEQRLHSAVQQYAARANRSTVGLTGVARSMTDIGAAGAGAAAGSMFGPMGAAVGAGAGAGLSEKAQGMLLRRAYEGATKSAANAPKGIAGAVKNAPAELQIGNAIKSSVPDPIKFAPQMDAEDIKTVRNYLDVVDGKVESGGSEDLGASSKMDELLSAMGIKDSAFATQKAKDQYITALRDHYESGVNEGDKKPTSIK